MTTLRSFWAGPAAERGQALILIAVTLMGMLMAVGLAIDSGQLFVARRTMQEAADAGAYAGAVYIYQYGMESGVTPPSSTTLANAVTVATGDVTRNGFTGDCTTGSPTKVCVSTGPFGTDSVSRYVFVTLETQVKTTLVPAQSGLTTVKVHAVAGAVPLNNQYGIMALDRGNTPNALDVEAHGKVTINGAGILVNSTATTYAAYDQCSTGAGFTGCPNVTASGPIDVTGGFTGTGWSSTPVSGYAQQPDPFAGYPKPSTAGLTIFDASNPPPTPSGGTPQTVTLSPGIYKVPINYAGRVNATLLTGTYIFEAGLNGSGNLDITTGAGGVFIFNTLTNYPDPGPGDTCGAVLLSGNVNTSLTAETTGPYKGLLFYQDPACTQTFTISGNGSLTATGTIYAPQAAVVLNGNNATLNGSQVVAKTVAVQNGNVSVTFNAGTTAQPVLPRLAQ